MTLKIIFLQLLFTTTFTLGNNNFFPKIDGYQRMGEIEIYNPDNLYDVIDGAADSYLNYDFQELQLLRYKGENKQYLQIEVYRHADKNNAFGIYSNERPTKGNWVDVGAQGYYESKVLNFYKGQYYVKLMGFKIDNIEEFLLDIAKKVANNIDGENVPPKILSLFPKEGKIDNSERFINKNFLGYESLTAMFTSDYIVNNISFKIFITEKKDDDSCKKMLENYFKSIKNKKGNIAQGIIHIKDPYQGEYNILWRNNIVTGVLDSPDNELSEKYLKMIREKINKRNY